MPYISSGRRRALDPLMVELIEELRSSPTQPGDLAYVLTRISFAMMSWMPTYTLYSHVIGVLETMKLEMVRRIGSLLEGGAIIRNGDLDEFQQIQHYLEPGREGQ